ENQLIETTTRLLTSYQIFLNQARENATNQITANQTQAINNINQAKENATTQINTNKQEVLNNITQEKNQATSEIIEAKKTAFNELLETLKPKFSGLFAGVYFNHNVIYIKGGWEQKIKDLSDYTLEKSKKGE
ncbi:ATPase, partial [Helicobacter pylori]